jgi:plastocyanin
MIASYGRIGRILAVAGAGLLASIVPATAAGATTATFTVAKVAIASTGCTGTAFCFKPKSLKVSSGQSVKWTNTTIAPHTVTRCTVAACGVSGGTGTDPGPNSPTLSTKGSTYKLKFRGRGTYVYYCQIHGYAVMHGTIIVK